MALSFHLPGQQYLVYNEDDPIDEFIAKGSVSRSKFLAWMIANRKYPQARELTYADFPIKFVWLSHTREWKPRDRGFGIGRITYVPPTYVETYSLRVLLNIVKGPRSFEEIRTINGVIYPSFRDACYALGLLDDDKEYIEAIKEASFWASGRYLRRLFAVMSLSNSIAMPIDVWNATWDLLTDDILYRKKKKSKSNGMLFYEQF